MNMSIGKMVLPFQPLTVAFRDVQYYVNIPMVTILILLPDSFM